VIENCRPLASEDTIDAGIVQKIVKNCHNVSITDEPLLFICIE